MPQATLNVRKSKKRQTARTRSRGGKKVNRTRQAMQIHSSDQAILYRPMGGTMLKRTLVFAQNNTIDPGAAGTGAVKVYRANSMYDPDATGVGAQPRGFDQYMLMYDHFVVLGSKITVHAYNSDATQPVLFGIALKDINTVSTNPNIDYTENGNMVCEVLGTAADSGKGKLVYAANPAKFLGRKSPLSDPELKGSSGANPAEQCYYHVWVQPISTGTDISPTKVIVVIEYFSAFIEGKDPGGS